MLTCHPCRPLPCRRTTVPGLPGSNVPKVNIAEVNGASSVTANGTIVMMASERSIATRQRRSMSAFEVRLSLVVAIASQASSVSQRLVMDLASETAKYIFPKRFDARNLEEALMSVPDLETVKFRVLKRTDQYEIREVEPYFIAVATMPGKSGFDFNGASQSFNVLAEYLFGKNTVSERMEMTTPVLTRMAQSNGEKMEMTTPVVTRKAGDKEEWEMSFVMPSKYGFNLPLPKDPSVRIEEIPRKTVAVVAFPGFVTDELVKVKESELRNALRNDSQFQVKSNAAVEVAQYNPPFTLPFMRRNEVLLEVESTR